MTPRRETDSKEWGGARSGAGRKPSEEPKEKLTFSIPKDMTIWLRNRAVDQNVSMSEIVTEALALLKARIEENEQTAD